MFGIMLGDFPNRFFGSFLLLYVSSALLHAGNTQLKEL
jgi:hypothetical protein